MPHPIFVSFEGGEGAGKTTQVRALARRLSSEGYQVLLTREPGGTALGEVVRRWLKTRPGLTPTAELFLFTAARAQHVAEVIAPALSSQQIVVCDRFAASTVAYQGYGRGLDLELISRLNDTATSVLPNNGRPDLTVLLDVPVEAGLARKKGILGDTFESEAVDFHQRVRGGYLAQASRDPERWFVVDGTQKRSTLAAQIWAKVQPLL